MDKPPARSPASRHVKHAPASTTLGRASPAPSGKPPMPRRSASTTDSRPSPARTPPLSGRSSTASGLQLPQTRLSSLDLMRMQIDAQIAECPKDERKTREYLHRAKLACGVTMARRNIGRPPKEVDLDSSLDSDSRSIASQPARGADGVELPKISSSAPPSPHQQREGSPRRPEEVRKSRPIWEGAHSLARDKNALTSRARLEGGIDVEFKIPNDVTWSANMSTKSRVWCDFLLDRPKRVWNWQDKLEKIHHGSAEGKDTLAAPSGASAHRILEEISSESAAPLKSVIPLMNTRQDVAQAHYSKKMSVKCERTLRRLFKASIMPKAMGVGSDINPVETAIQQLHSGAFYIEGPEDTETDVSQLSVPEGVIDARSFNLLLTRLNVFNELVNKTKALSIIADIKGENKNISFPHFRAAFKQVLVLGRKNIVEVMGLYKEGGALWERCADSVEESIREARDQQLVHERAVLGKIIEEMKEVSDAPSRKTGSVSTYGLQAQAGALQADTRGQMDTPQDTPQKEGPLLGDLKEMLDGFQETIHENKQEHEAMRQKREAMNEDLCSLLESVTDALADTVDQHSQMGSPLNSSASPLKSPIRDTKPHLDDGGASPSTFSPMKMQMAPNVKAALKEPPLNHLVDIGDTSEAVSMSIHCMRLTNGRRKAPPEDLDLGDMYFTDSDSEDEKLGVQLEDSKEQDVEQLKKHVQDKVGTALKLIRADETDASAESQALTLIEEVCRECGMEGDASFVSMLMSNAQSSQETIKHQLIEAVKAGKRTRAMSALIKALNTTDDQQTVMSLLRYFLRQLRSLQPAPSRDPAWAFRLSAQPSFHAPRNLLVLQAVRINFKYRNQAAEQVAAFASSSSGIVKETRSFHPVLGWGGDNVDDLEDQGLVAAQDAHPPRPPTPEAPPKLETASALPPKPQTPVPKQEATEAPVEGEDSAEGAGEGEGPKTPPGPSETELLVQELKQEIEELRVEQGWRRQETQMREDWEVNRMVGGLKTEMRKRLEPARALLEHPPGDWIGICRLRPDQAAQRQAAEGRESGAAEEDDLHRLLFKPAPTSFVMEECEEEIRAIHRKAQYLDAQDVFVEVMEVPSGNDGAIHLPRGIGIPGTYVLKYFTECSPLPLAVSEHFVVDFPKVHIDAPAQIEIGRNMQLKLSVVNFDFELAAASGIEPPHMCTSDSVAIFAVGDMGEDLDCVWSQKVHAWTQQTDYKITSFKPPSPGQYRIKYRLGQYENSVAGETKLVVKFPRRGANRFSTFELETLSIQEIREARVFVSLNLIDMEEEVDIIMKQVASMVQSEVEELELTCTFVCLNFRQDKEETTFDGGVCPALRRSLAEIDKCRPFFVSLMGERYGLVPSLRHRDSKGMREIYEEYPWMAKNKNPFVNTALGYSVLEIELLYAVLMVEPEAALVYNREISYVHNEVAPEQRSKYLEVGCGEMKTAAARSAMADLRMRLRAVPDLKQRAYEHPKAIAQILKEDLVREICSKFPQSSTPTARERDRIMIESISKAHFQIIDTGIFTDMVEEIDQAIAQESCRIVLIPGAPCSGKTALCAHYKKRHVLKFMEVRDGSGVDFSSCLLNDGPRPDLTPHMLITSFISHLGDPRIDSVLRHLYSEIRRLSSSSFLLPVDGDCLENFPRFMKEEACKHGLVWLIDGLDQIVGIDSWQFLAQLPAGVQVIATCNAGRADLVQSIEALPSSRLVTLGPLDAGHTWSVQQQYCLLYGTEPDDELAWKIVEAESDKSACHVRVILMAHRLMSEEGAPFTDISDIINSEDAERAFVKLVLRIQQWEPLLARVLLMMAWSHRGLREMELLALIDSLNQTQLRRYKEMLLDELLLPLFGIYDFITPSLKMALRRSMLAKESRKDWALASPCLEALIVFFANPKNASAVRRSVECPTLFSSDSSMDNLFEYITTSESASHLIVSSQTHLLASYLERVKLNMASFAGLILDSLQQQFGVRVEVGKDETETKSSKSSLSLSASLNKIFHMFAVHNGASHDGSHHASKVAFATKNESTFTMNLDDWMHAVEYLELMDDTEACSLSREDAMSIFVRASGSDKDAEISFLEFRHALIQVGKKLDLQLSDLVQRSLHIAQLHKLFNFYAAGATAGGGAQAGSGAVGQRARTLDMQEFAKMLDHLGLSRKLSKHDQYHFFKQAQEANKVRAMSLKGDKGMASPMPGEKSPMPRAVQDAGSVRDFEVPNELDFFELKWCVRAMAEHLKTDLDHLVGVTLDTFFANEKKVQEAPQYVIDIAGFSDEKQQNFIKQCMRIAELFCELGAYEGSIDVAELLLRKCYDIENFVDIGNSQVEHVYGSSDDIAHALAIYSRCAFQETLALSKIREGMKRRSEDLTNSIADASQKETLRRKQLSTQRMTVALRREDEELHAAYSKKSERLQKELMELQGAMADNTNHLRWIRRRASTAGQAALNVMSNFSGPTRSPGSPLSLSSAATSPQLLTAEMLKNKPPEMPSKTIARLSSCIQVFAEDPASQWGQMRSQIKELTENPLDCHDPQHINLAMPLHIDVLTLFRPNTKVKKLINKNLTKILGAGGASPL